MNCLKIFADEGGDSHFDEVVIPLADAAFAPPAALLLISEWIQAKNLIFYIIPKDWNGDWHITPARQYFLLLSGLLEVEASDGDVRRLATGTPLLLEDTSGKGHVTGIIGEADARGGFVQLP
jgi:hypothetical protein